MAMPWLVDTVVLEPTHIKFMQKINSIINDTKGIIKGWPQIFQVTLEEANLNGANDRTKLSQWFITLQNNFQNVAGILETPNFDQQNSHAFVQRAILLLNDMRETQRNTSSSIPGIPTLNAIIDAHKTTADALLSNHQQVGDHIWTALHMLTKIVENLHDKAYMAQAIGR